MVLSFCFVRPTCTVFWSVRMSEVVSVDQFPGASLWQPPLSPWTTPGKNISLDTSSNSEFVQCHCSPWRNPNWGMLVSSHPGVYKFCFPHHFDGARSPSPDLSRTKQLWWRQMNLTEVSTPKETLWFVDCLVTSCFMWKWHKSGSRQ